MSSGWEKRNIRRRSSSCVCLMEQLGNDQWPQPFPRMQADPSQLIPILSTVQSFYPITRPFIGVQKTKNVFKASYFHQNVWFFPSFFNWGKAHLITSLLSHRNSYKWLIIMQIAGLLILAASLYLLFDSHFSHLLYQGNGSYYSGHILLVSGSCLAVVGLTGCIGIYHANCCFLVSVRRFLWSINQFLKLLHYMNLYLNLTSL